MQSLQGCATMVHAAGLCCLMRVGCDLLRCCKIWVLAVCGRASHPVFNNLGPAGSSLLLRRKEDLPLQSLGAAVEAEHGMQPTGP